MCYPVNNRKQTFTSKNKGKILKIPTVYFDAGGYVCYNENKILYARVH